MTTDTDGRILCPVYRQVMATHIHGPGSSGTYFKGVQSNVRYPMSQWHEQAQSHVPPRPTSRETTICRTASREDSATWRSRESNCLIDPLTRYSVRFNGIWLGINRTQDFAQFVRRPSVRSNAGKQLFSFWSQIQWHTASTCSWLAPPTYLRLLRRDLRASELF
ncbi:hypothetical protein VTK73DRAFT_7688 [Phialemonium thermophilum]|uniref:Uncharacterized protein n=1 Tax=Phialemonium thermophilum TaxID=223376 RepID=A0ABR3XSW1_9PEZI